MAIRDLGFPTPGPQPVPPRPQRRRRWTRIAAWLGGIIVLLLVVVGIGLVVLLRSASFHDYLLRTVRAKTSESLNTEVRLQNFAIHPSTLSLDLYGLTVMGTGPGANRPVLQVDHLGGGVRVISWLHRQWNFDSVAVDHPVVNLIVDAAGNNNLPTPQSSGTSSSTNIFDLAVRHAVLNRGEIYYNDRKNILNADLHDLEFVSNYDAAAGRYYGNLSYSNGHVTYGSYAPMPHDLSAKFEARRDGLRLSNVTLKSGASQLLLDASLNNYSSPKVHAKYSLNLATEEFRRALNNPSLPIGVVAVNGIADYVNDPSRPLLNTVTAEGEVSSADLAVRTPSLRTNIRSLGASYHLANGNADIQNLRARLLGGELSGAGTVRDLAGNQQGHVTVALRGISLADLKNLANAESLKQVAISGNLNAKAVANWSGSPANLVATADVDAKSNVAPASAAANAVPLDAAIHAHYVNASGQVSLANSYLHTPQTTVDLNGTVSQTSVLQVHVQANDLHELETVADLFSKPAPGQPSAQPLGLYGTATFNGTVRGSVRAPQINGQLTASNLKVRDSSFRALRTNITASPSLVSLQNGILEPATQGRLTFNVQSGLKDWAYTPSSPIVVNLNASQLSLAELAHAANSTTPVSGTLNANVAVHGSQLNPIGQGDVKLTNARLSGEPIQLADVNFQGTGDQVHANLLVRIAGGTAKGKVTYFPKDQGYDAMLEATNIQLAQLETLKQRNLQMAGALTLTASGRGTFKNPQGHASLTIPQLDVQKQQIKNINLDATVVNQQATFALHSQVLDTPLQAQGKVGLTGDYYADASVDTPLIQLRPLVAVYAPAQAANLTGQTEIHASLKGPLKDKTRLEAHLNIPTLGVNYQATEAGSTTPVQVQIGAVTPIRADYANGILSLQPGEIKGTDTDIRFRGNIPLQGNTPSTLSVLGSVDLALAELFNPDLSSGGKMEFDVNAEARQGSPDVEGQIRIVNASFSTADTPVGLSKGNGVLTLRRDRLEISKFTGEVGGGAVTATGGVAYRPSVQFDIALKGSGMRMLYPPTVRSDLGLNLALTGNTDSAVLSGQINIDRLSFTPDFDLANFLNQFSGDSVPPPSQGFADNLRLNIGLRTTSELNAVSRALSLEGDANLHVIGTASNPVIIGRANLSGGDLIFLGNRYVVQGGTIAFVNTVQTQPILNLQVTTTIQQYNISMRFQGPLDRLRTNYTSDPALPPADIINLLAFGKTQEASAAAPAQSTTLGAESVIASQVTSQVTNRLEKVAGISQLSVDPVLAASGNQSPGARVTIQQRVTSKLFVTFATDVTSTSNQQVQLEYHINRKWSVSGVRDQNGGFGLDGRYHKDF